MKIYDLGNEGAVYCLVNPEYKAHLRYTIRDADLTISTKNDYDESELIADVPEVVRDFIFWTMFVAYKNPRFHSDINNDVFEAFIKVIS